MSFPGIFFIFLMQSCFLLDALMNAGGRIIQSGKLTRNMYEQHSEFYNVRRDKFLLE
jgi:hypothetical protein